MLLAFACLCLMGCAKSETPATTTDTAAAPTGNPAGTQAGNQAATPDKMAMAPAQTAAAPSAPAAGSVKTASGLVYEELRAGTGPSPTASDVVKVNYRGTLTNGTEFDSSYKRNEPAVFPLNRVIPCWTEGVQHMKVGGKARLTCPSAIAYGAAGSPPVIPGGATLIFEIELLGIGPN